MRRGRRPKREFKVVYRKKNLIYCIYFETCRLSEEIDRIEREGGEIILLSVNRDEEEQK